MDLEAIDVQAGAYVGYDSEGRLLTLTAMLGQVDVCLAEETPSHPDELETALRRYLTDVGETEAADAQNQLEDLVKVCQKFALF